MFPIRLLAAGVVAVAGAASAHGQGCDSPGGCGSPLFGTGALFAANKHHARYPTANQPLCASRTYPISDWAYIRKYCGPTLNPGTCYGHYPTKWRRWEEACPQYAAGNSAAVYTGATPGLMGIPPMAQPLTPEVPSTPVPAPLPPVPSPLPPNKETAPNPVPKTDPVPKTNPIPKTESVPKTEGAPEIPAPMTLAPAPLRAVPMATVSVTLPDAPADLGRGAGNNPVPPLKTLPNIVTPPVRDR